MLKRINMQRILCTKNANVCLSSHDRITLREICPENESDIILYTENNPDKSAKEFMLCTH